MSKFVIYHVISPLGYAVDIMSDGKPGGVTYEQLFADEPMRLMKIEKTGAKVLKSTEKASSVVNVPLEASQSTTSSQAPQERPDISHERHCQQCGGVMSFKEGISKTGKPWKGYFCPSLEKHPVEWVK